MKSNQQPKPAFTLESDDRFHAIVASNPVKYEQEPDAETILTFFAVRRATGLIDFYNVMKIGFTEGIREKTNFTITWNMLDLSSVSRQEEQEGNRINVYKLSGFSLN